MGVLARFRITPDRIEVDKLAVIFGRLLTPDDLHGFDPLPQYLPAALKRSAVVLHFLSVPPTTDTEDQASVGELIDCGNFLGQNDGIMFNHEANPTAHFDGLGHRCRSHERDKEIMGVPIVFRQVGTTWPRAAPAGGDMGVLWEPDRLEAALFASASEIIRSHRIISSKHSDA